jgi:hypothetical protein
MKLAFDLEKSMAAVACLLTKSATPLTVLFLIKMLYAADREALVGWHRTITGDQPVSMDNGPVLSRIYNLMRGQETGKCAEAWSKVFQPLEKNSMKLQPDVNVEKLVDHLSDREIDALNHAYEKVQRVKGKIGDWAHKEFPEWEDPKSSSKPIDFALVLKNQGLSAEEVASVVAEIEQVQSAKRALKVA